MSHLVLKFSCRFLQLVLCGRVPPPRLLGDCVFGSRVFLYLILISAYFLGDPPYGPLLRSDLVTSCPRILQIVSPKPFLFKCSTIRPLCRGPSSCVIKVRPGLLFVWSLVACWSTVLRARGVSYPPSPPPACNSQLRYSSTSSAQDLHQALKLEFTNCLE